MKKQTLKEEVSRMRDMMKKMTINEKWVWTDDDSDDDNYDDESDEYRDSAEYGDDHDPTMFANSGSALSVGDRTKPCPTCGEPDKLTIKDARMGYQCDDCADTAERGY
jgi:hypothetical protein